MYHRLEIAEPYNNVGIPSVQYPFPVGCLQGEEIAYAGYLSILRSGTPLASYITSCDLKHNRGRVSPFYKSYMMILESSLSEESRKRNHDHVESDGFSR